MATAKKKAPAKKAAAKKTVAKKAPAKKAAKKTVTVQKNQNQPPEGEIKLTVRVNGEVYETLTNDIAVALHGLKDEIGVIKTMFVVSAEYKGKVVEKVYNVHYARRLLSNDVTATLHEKNFKLALAFNVE